MLAGDVSALDAQGNHRVIQLRPYQNAILDEVRALIRSGVRRILIVSPTGSGKTALSTAMLQGASARNNRSWFICHRRELIDQTSETFRSCELRHGIIAASYAADPRQLVQLCGIQSLTRRMDRLTPPKLAIIDEAQHLPSKSWSNVVEQLPDAIHVLLSATPERLDGAGLGGYADAMVQGPSVRELIDAGYLSDYRLFAPKLVDTQGLHSRMGDFVQAEAEALMDRRTITGDAIREYTRHCHGKRALVRAVSIKHSQHIVEQFKAAGIPSAHVDGTTDPTIRKALFDAFRKSEILVLSQVDIANEGVDVPGIEAAIDLRPTQSMSMTMQFWGRALRPQPGKVAIILDHVGNAARHGFPDTPREWTLEGRKKNARAATDTPIKTCDMCFRTLPAAAARCPCGYVFEAQAREVDQVEGELTEVDVLAQRRAVVVEQARARSLDALIALGIKRHGPDKGPRWAKHVHAGREEKARREAAAMAERYERETGT